MKRITQRVKLSPLAHARIAKAQRDVGLARFDEALGYFVEGVLRIQQPKVVSHIAEYMRVAMSREDERKA